MKGQFRGEWWTDGGSSGGALVLLLIGAAILIGSGAAAAIATALMAVLIALGAVVVLTIAGLGAWLVYRARREQLIVRPSVIITSPERAPLPPPAAGAVDGPRPAALPAAREMHQHWHLHIGAGADPQEIAAIMRQIRKED